MIDARCRTELLACAVFAALSVIVRVAFRELYPFSVVPVFSDAPRTMCAYRAWDPDGRPIRPARLGLQRNYWGIPASFPSGLEPPATLDVPGQVPTEAAVRDFVQARLAKLPGLAFVVVEQRVLGAVDERRVGVTRVSRWKIRNAAATPPSPR
jgi:hypothetical protein